jgi:hypothetical protein
MLAGSAANPEKLSRAKPQQAAKRLLGLLVKQRLTA